MIDWTQIDTVLLDMDGTLLDLYFDNWFWQKYVPAEYARHKNIPEKQAFDWLEDWIRHHQGTLNWYCLDFWTDELGMNIASMKRAVSDRVRIRPGAKDFLAALAQSPKQTILVTNAHRDALDTKINRTCIDQYFDAMVCSHDYGAAKEARAFWLALQQHHPFDPSRTLFIDDSMPVLTAAREYGIEHLLSILQPDSSLPPRQSTAPFSAVDDYQPLTRALLDSFKTSQPENKGDA